MKQPDIPLIADLLPQIIWTAQSDGVVDYVNGRWATYVGDEVDGLGWSWKQLVAADDLWLVLPRWQRAISTGEAFEVECRLRRADGVFRWHLIRGNPVRDEQGHVRKWVGTLTDIEDQKSVDEASLRLAAIVESCDDAVLGMTLGGMISSWNAAAQRMFGYEASEAIGRHISLIVPAERSEESRHLLEVVSRGECVTHYETTRLHKDGWSLEVSLTVSPIMDRQGRLIGISKISRDITQQKRAQMELRQAKEAAEEANRAKDRFLAMLSHELRTPLTPVLAVVTGLRSSHHWPRELREELEIIHRSVELEARLIDDLLDLTGIARGTVRLHREVVDVHPMVQAAAEVCGAEIASKSLELQLQFEAAQSHVDGDAARIQQIFWNLLRNAVKFTPARGRIGIRTWNGPRPGQPAQDKGAHAGTNGAGTNGAGTNGAGTNGAGTNGAGTNGSGTNGSGTNGSGTNGSGTNGSGDNESALIVEITDSGIGIDPELLPRLFVAFEQGKDSNNGRFAGLGMGLAMAKALVEMHGGGIEAASAGQGLGAVFKVWLPVVRSAGKSGGVRPAVVAAPLQELRILLVEDHESSRRVLARLLRNLNHRVTVARDMESALKAASEMEFDLLISDLGLPDGTGLELMRRLRARQPLRGICLSGFGTEEDLQRSREAGFIAHLTKPISFQTLQAAIRQVLSEPASAG